jgi:cytochrome P450
MGFHHHRLTMSMRALAELPGPKGLPLVGNLHELKLDQLHQALGSWCREFGTVCCFRIGTRPVVVVADPHLIQSILRNRPTRYRRLGAIEPVFEEMGMSGVFSAEGMQWKRQRRLTANALDMRHLRQFFPALVRVTGRLQKRWLVAAELREPSDIQQDLMRYTVDVTTNLAFGYDMNTLEEEGDVIQQHLKRIFPKINSRINAAFPYWRYFRLPSDRALDRSLESMRSTINDFITAARARLSREPDLRENPTNFLEAMLSADDEGEAAFTDQEIYGNILQLLLAGEDTTANTLAWMMHLMVEHPEVQRPMRDEAEQATDPEGLLPNQEATEHLPYIEAVALEAMRLKPVAPILFIEPNEDVEVGDVAIPKGTAMMLLTSYAVQNDAYFRAAAKFDPERWLNIDRSDSNGHDMKAFLPFGFGPRFCPGRNLAMVEIKMAMAMICSTFVLSKPKNAPSVDESFSFAMEPKSLYVLLESI